MIGTEQERAALKRILAVLKPILTDHKPPIAIDWVGKGSIAVGREFESAINAVREHKDDDAIRAMLAPDDAVIRTEIAAVIATRIIHPNAVYMNGPFRSRSEQDRCEWAADEIIAILRGEATRDE